MSEVVTRMVRLCSAHEALKIAKQSHHMGIHRWKECRKTKKCLETNAAVEIEKQSGYCPMDRLRPKEGYVSI